MARPGLLAFGAYVPRRRLERKAIHAATGWATGGRGGQAAGRRSYCAWDEDSLTMAVEAARDCLAGADRAAVRQVVFASTTHPWSDRSNAGVVAGALNLDESVRASDASGHQQAGLGALLEACTRLRDGEGEILVIAADRRIARPASEQELRYGHGAAAVRVGTGPCVAELLGSQSLRGDFVDHYRAAGADVDYALEERWVRDEGYLKLVPRAIAGALEACAVPPSAVRHLVVQGPTRHAATIARALGISADAIRDDLQAECGDTGVAHPLLMLGGALESAVAGDAIVVAGFGQGCDALVLRATGRSASVGAGCRGALAAGAADTDYLRFLANCGLVEFDWGARAERDNRTAQTVAWRRHRDLLGFVGGRCTQCGTVQFPRTRACVNPVCRAFDAQIEHPLAESRGTVKTYTEDWLAVTRSPPCVYGNVALEDGANVFVDFTDTGPGALAVGTPVRFVFRIKDFDAVRGFRRYFWKATPVES